MSLIYMGGFTKDLTDRINEGKAFTLTTGDLAGSAGTEVARVLIRNPVGSNKTMKIFRIEEGTYTSTGNSIFRYYRDFTLTSVGTALPVSPVVIGQSSASSIEAYINPVVSGNGVKMQNPIAGQMSINSRQWEYLWILPPGQQMLVNVRTNAGTTTWGLSIFWVEE